ncbi:ubiquitin-protein ligase, putative [Ricinus communis]|uniref:Ubiquitin-protein ligase, putative n=2 Tax=Ricinus communis TaxID=3988 RepID=B9RST8_RICCO|nr:ubiquitin-protein ligase, putative [Ricinus communis]|eukprot:XP_025012721.1 F-box/kelch-repeat protein At3g06240-like [Ricinus communis]
MANLVQDVVLHILLRLPVKSLCRFKVVCKSWWLLISDPHFISMHLSLATKNNCINCHRWRLCLTSFSLPSVYSVGYEASDRAIAIKLGYPLKSDCYDEVKFIGSCNGLLCVASEPGVLLLLNPSTRAAQEIPRLGNRRPFTQSSLPYMYGFGYAHSINDYKLVKISCRGCVFVYSVKENSWRSVGGFPYSILALDPGIQLNGAIHWVVSRSKDSTKSQIIGAFDLVEEKFWDVPPPVSVHNFYGIGVFGECLCILPGSDVTSHNDFWVMKRYGIRDSWTKVVINISYFRMKPLGVFDNHKALLEIDGKLVLYSFREGTYQDLVIQGIPVGIEFDVETYAESLVSPHLRLEFRADNWCR